LSTTSAVREGRPGDAEGVGEIIRQWLGPDPPRGRNDSIAGALASGEVLVAASASGVVGFIHYVMHRDIIDGAPNAFITAFCVQEKFRRAGIGTSLLSAMVEEARRRGAVSVETSTTHSHSKRFYENRGFRQTVGDIGESFLELELDQTDTQ
jgi:GNAT superfamily N-acetyltransferase